MKIFKLALLASALPALSAIATSGAHPTLHTALAMEPASWVFVAFGLAGGGFLRKRGLKGLDITSATRNTAPHQQ